MFSETIVSSVGDIDVVKSSPSLDSSSSKCLAQADSHSRGLDDRTDRDSIVSSPAILPGSADG